MTNAEFICWLIGYLDDNDSPDAAKIRSQLDRVGFFNKLPSYLEDAGQPYRTPTHHPVYYGSPYELGAPFPYPIVTCGEELQNTEDHSR